MELIHATCVEIDGAAVLLRGPSGSGKSDLALRLIDGGARLVADDQVHLSVLRGELVATAPAALAGRMEVRGLGLVDLAPAQRVPHARVVLAVDLGPTAAVARLPEADGVEHVGILIPRVILAPFEASAAAKVRVALAIARRGGQIGLAPLAAKRR
jgi:HPr kinase/phosphorylase